MSEFKELVKSFAKSREYVRDFFVYGFKTREDFNRKSTRTYDNERRRIECWLQGFVKQDYTKKGKNISLAIDSNLLDTNPLFRVWKTKSFTDNDLILHFTLLDYLAQNPCCSAEMLTDALNLKYNLLFDVQTVRRKCNAYVKEGIFIKTKQGKEIKYSAAKDFTPLFHRYPAFRQAITFYQLAEPLGIIGNTIMDNFSMDNFSFRVKHSFFVHTLEDEVLLELLHAMHSKESISLELCSTKNQNKSTRTCIPLQIFTSTRTGRRFLCAYQPKSKRFNCIRIDSIKNVTPLPPDSQENKDFSRLWDEHQSNLIKNHPYIWGVSFQNTDKTHLQHIKLTLRIREPEEHYIMERLIREGKDGIITCIAPNTYTYEKDIFDANEMLPWLRTFIGRIVNFTCSSPVVERRFFQDLQKMYDMYDIKNAFRD